MDSSGIFYLTVFVSLLVFFGFIVKWRSWTLSSAKEFFHFGNSRENFISLFATNITIGTGLSYLLISGWQNGLLMLFVPIGVIIGYFGLEKFVSWLPENLRSGDNFISSAHKATIAARQNTSILSWIMTIPLVLVFVLIFAYEIFVTSQLLTGLILGKSDIWWQAGISTLLFSASLIYCSIGGVRAVFRTDKLQLAGILLFVGILVYTVLSFGYLEIDNNEKTATWFKSDTQTIINVLLAVIASIATQIYSLLNWFVVSNVTNGAARKFVLRSTGISISFVFTIMIFVGATTSFDWASGLAGVTSELFEPYRSGSHGMQLLIAIIIVGLTCAILSTIDTIMITVSMFSYDNIVGRSSYDSSRSNDAVAFVRGLLATLFVIAFVSLAAMFYMRPNLFYLLLAISSGAAVFAPLIILIGVLASWKQGLSVLTDQVLLLYGIIFVSAISLGMWASGNMQELVPYVSLIHLLTSILLSLAIAGYYRLVVAER